MHDISLTDYTVFRYLGMEIKAFGWMKEEIGHMNVDIGCWIDVGKAYVLFTWLREEI